eukprot:5026147-Amphidinium_carterae.1
MEEMQLHRSIGRAVRAPTVRVDLERLNSASPLSALLWLEWLPTTEATAVEEGQQSISLIVMLVVLWFCCAVSFWLGVRWRAKKEKNTEEADAEEEEPQLCKVWTTATGESQRLLSLSHFVLRAEDARSVKEYRQCQLCRCGSSGERSDSRGS